MPTAQLPDRTAILTDGPDAEHFLQNIVTTDLDGLAQGEVKPGALLTPQGKILFDFLISRRGETGFILDCRADVADDFLRRLAMYKLRAKVEISRQEQEVVSVFWQNDSDGSQIDSGWLADRRFLAETRVWRYYGNGPVADAAASDFTRLRIAHGVAESGDDYALGNAFPHDVLLDQSGGIGFRKGCYVGQEVVSRMQHRGTARRRVMLVEGAGDLPSSGTDVTTGGRAIGTLGGVAGPVGIAVVRIDRVADALDSGTAIEIDGAPVTLSIPPWATYTLPQDEAVTDGGD